MEHTHGKYPEFKRLDEEWMMVFYDSLSFNMLSEESLIQKVNVKLLKLISFILT